MKKENVRGNEKSRCRDYEVKQNKLLYGLFRFLSNAYSRLIFKRRYIRNEIKDAEGGAVIIANHQAALDFVNLIGATERPMNFVISSSFYNTIPLKGVMPRLGLIPKQQFQTDLIDLHRMKHVVDKGGILVIYPAGLMSEDGTATPTPVATYSFLKWLKCDVYMAKTIGTYFAMPKWRRGGARAGKTFIDIYKLFGKEELAESDAATVRERTEGALAFDAYREQQNFRVKYKNGDNIEGLEDVLYMCPHCKKEFTVKVKNGNHIYCESCGFEERADEYQLLHKVSEGGREIRRPSDWNAVIMSTLKNRMECGELTELTTPVKVRMIVKGRRRFEDAGEGVLTLTRDHFLLRGKIAGEADEITVPIASFAALPYKPGKYLELQLADKIYRCLPEDGRLAVKLVNMVKIYYEMHNSSCSNARVLRGGSSEIRRRVV